MSCKGELVQIRRLLLLTGIETSGLHQTGFRTCIATATFGIPWCEFLAS